MDAVTASGADVAALPLRRRRSRGDAQQRSAALREAALALFAEKGFDATPTEDIAARAGVAKGTLFLYFHSKERLLEAAVESPVLDDLAAWAAGVEPQGDGSDALRRTVAAIAARLRSDAIGRIHRLVATEGARVPALRRHWQAQVERPLQALVGRVLRYGAQRGDFRAVDADLTAEALLLPLSSARLLPDGADADAPAGNCPRQAALAQLVDLVLHGLRR